VTAPTPAVNLIGKPGNTVSGGTFAYTNTEAETTEFLSDVTLNVTNPAVLSSITLCAAFDESNPCVTVAPPTSNSVFTFSPPLQVPPGGTVNFTATAIVAGKVLGGVKSTVLSFKTGGGSSGGGFGIQATLGSIRDAASTHGSVLLASALLPMLFVMLVFDGGTRQRFIAAGFGMAMLGMTVTGCDPCPACTTAKLTTTDQYVVGVTVTDGEVTLNVGGLPVLISQISK
jgi:hypothetical protein